MAVAAAAAIAPSIVTVDTPISDSPLCSNHPRSRSATSVALSGRSSGFCARHCRISCASGSGSPGRTARGSGGGWVRRASAAAIGVCPANGSTPVTISNSINPNA